MPDRNRYTDRLFSDYIRARAQGRCERCHQPGEECAHLIRRRYLRTRWEPDNAWWLCRACHQLVDEHALEFALLVEQTIGTVRFEELQERSKPTSGPKPNRDAIRTELRELRKLLA